MSQFTHTDRTNMINIGLHRHSRSAILFGGFSLLLAFISMSLAIWAPLGFSIVAVFLFAGPHNWFEFRYFLTRMPAKWGPRKGFFTLGIAGAVTLTVLFGLQTYLAHTTTWSAQKWMVTTAIWSSALVIWTACLWWLHQLRPKGHDSSLCFAIAFLMIGVVWMFPTHWAIGLVYLHPLVAMWFLHRELKKHKPHWLKAYYVVLGGAGLMLSYLWLSLAGAPDLPGDDALSLRISNHSGASVFRGISTHLLVATHVFLEMVHYAIWLIAIPLVSIRRLPWDLTSVPLAKKSINWRRAVYGIMAIGLALIVIFWIGFAANYAVTRDIYFTVAILHVLIEVPFVIRSI